MGSLTGSFIFISTPSLFFFAFLKQISDLFSVLISILVFSSRVNDGGGMDKHTRVTLVLSVSPEKRNHLPHTVCTAAIVYTHFRDRVRKGCLFFPFRFFIMSQRKVADECFSPSQKEHSVHTTEEIRTREMEISRLWLSSRRSSAEEQQLDEEERKRK